MSDKDNMMSQFDFGRLMERVDTIAEHTKCLPVIKAELAKVKERVQRTENDIKQIETGAKKAVKEDIKTALVPIETRIGRNEGEIEKIRTGAWKVVIIFLGAIVGSLFAGVSVHLSLIHI